MCVCVRVCVCVCVRACNCVATSRRLTQRLLLPLLASGIRRGGGLSSAGSDNQAGPSGAASAVSALAGSDAPPCWTISTLPPEARLPSRRSESLEHKA